MAKKHFYAVHRGRVPGVYRSWPEAERQVKGFSGARYKGFQTESSARAFCETGRDAIDHAAGASYASGAGAARYASGGPRKRPAPVTARYAVYTDGGCRGNRNVSTNRTQPAGWGAVVRDRGGATIAELYGPVELEKTSPYFLGAEVRSNNTGELSGIAEGLLWLLTVRGPGDAAIYYDSKYAANITQGLWNAEKNRDLAAKCRDLLARVKAERDVSFVHVKGHSGDPGNERADALVQLGMQGSRSGRLRFHEEEGLPLRNEDEELLDGPSKKKKKKTTKTHAAAAGRSTTTGIIDLTTGDD